MQTLTISATWPDTVLTVIGMRVAPPPSALAPPQPADAGGRAKFTRGSTWTWREPPAPTSRAVAVMSAASEAATRCKGLGPRDGQARGGQHQAQPQDGGGQGQGRPSPPRRGPHGEAQRGAV